MTLTNERERNVKTRKSIGWRFTLLSFSTSVGFALWGQGLVLAEAPVSAQTANVTSTEISTSKTPAATQKPMPPIASQPQLVQSYGKLPLQFERNDGQTAEQVKFLSRGRGYNLFLTPTEAVLALRHNSKKEGIKPSPTMNDSVGAGLIPAPSAVLRMQFEAANREAQIKGLEELPGRVNYFLGNNPKKWRTNIPTYAKVQYKDIYPGIDLVYYGTNQRQLEYDLVVSPGADPNGIKLAFDGAQDVKVDAKGNLAIQVSGGEVTLLQPHVYQEIKGKKQEIAARYILNAQQASNAPGGRTAVLVQVGIQVAAYDAKKPLIIDPILSYSTYLGGSDADLGHGIATDAAGNAYVTGYTLST
jgi:hypothetical protein